MGGRSPCGGPTSAGLPRWNGAGSPPGSSCYPKWAIVTYEFGERRGRPPVTLKWYDGGKTPPAALANGEPLGDHGCLFVGEHATIFCPGEYGQGGHFAGGGSLPQVPFEESPGHFTEWVNAMRGGPKAKSDIVAHSGPLTETVLLGNLAVRATGERLEWDARRLQVKGRPEFNSVIRPPYGKNWAL